MTKKIEDLISEIILDHYKVKFKLKKLRIGKKIRKVKGLITRLNKIKTTQYNLEFVSQRKIWLPILKKTLVDKSIWNLKSTTK